MNRFSRTCDALMEVAWLLALITVPLFFNYDSFRIFEVNKIAVFIAIMLIGLAAWVCKLISQGGVRLAAVPFKDILKQVHQVPLASPAAALALVILISSVFSISLLTSLMGSYNRFEGALTCLFTIFLFVLVAANMRRREQFERLLTVLAAVCLAVDGYSILQHFGLDPLYWNADIKVRAISTIGQYIFNAAFLSMAFFVLMGRAILAFQSFRSGGVSRATNFMLALLYSLVSLLNLLAIWYANSRGPLLGLFFGLGLFCVFFLLIRRMRRALVGLFGLAAVLVTFLIVLNLPGSPLASLRTSALLGPLGRLFESQTGTGRVRILMWQGMSRLTAPHAPLLFPDKSPDRWNALRLLVGYGPETLDLGFEGYYDSEIYALESRAFLLDRAHNEFWDVLYFYGILGLIVRYAFFLCFFSLGLRWLGLISSAWDRRLYWGLALAGGLLGSLLPVLAGTPEFIGLGFPLGLLAGLLGVIVYRVFHPVSAGRLAPGSWQELGMISILSAVLAHYVEILFGISVITSSLLLWLYAGLFVWMGWVWPASELVVDGPAGVLNPISNSAAQVGKFHDAAINAGLLSLIMVTLGASFLCTVQMNSGVWSTLSSVFVFRPALAEQTSYGMLWMFVGVFLFTALLLQLAQDALAGRKPNWAGIFISLGSALLISGLAWVIRASQLAGIAQAMVRQEDMVTISAGLPALLMGSLFVIFVIGLGLALVLGQLPAGRTGTTFSLTWLAGAGVAGVLLLTGVLLNAMCLRPLQSNSLFVQVLRLSGAHDYANALKIYDQVLPLAPTEIYHLRYAATLYGDAINSSSDPVQKERYFQAGLKPVQQAQALEPLSIDNTIALARFYRQGADFTADPALKNLRFFSANRNYAHALNVKPGRIDYWLEWAELQALTGDIQGAFEKVDRALAVDRTYAPTYQFLGDLYSVYADNLSVPAARADSLTRALQAYQNQAELLASQKANAAMAFFNVGKTYESMQKYSEAREAYRHSAELNLAENQWRVYKRIADVSALLKDPAGQRQFLQKALEAAPPAEKPALQSEINALAP